MNFLWKRPHRKSRKPFKLAIAAITCMCAVIVFYLTRIYDTSEVIAIIVSVIAVMAVGKYSLKNRGETQ